MKRNLDLVVLSDVHLGTYGCHAKELLQYLESIQPKKIILNGDIIDIWQFKKKFWPKPHMQVVQHLLGLIAEGVEVVYITGNHDEMLRKFTGLKFGSFELANKKVIDLNGKKAWFFHGDVFDITMKYSKWLTRLGAIGYDGLIYFNRLINICLERLGKEKMSFSKKVKNGVKSAVKYINDFEETVADIAQENKYDFVVCGHIHQPEIRGIGKGEKKVTYLNSGDWVEHLTALEYHNNSWSLYEYKNDLIAKGIRVPQSSAYLSTEELFERMVADFKTLVA